MTTSSLLAESLREIRKRKIDEQVTKRGKQMKKNVDDRVYTFERVKAAKEGLPAPLARQTARQKARAEAEARRQSATQLEHQEIA
jgi:hypothetical protein